MAQICSVFFMVGFHPRETRGDANGAKLRRRSAWWAFPVDWSSLERCEEKAVSDGGKREEKH